MFTQKASTFSTLIGSSLLSAGVVFVGVMPGQAASLSTSASCSGGSGSTCDSSITTEFLRKSLIDAFWSNTNPNLALGKDFTISNINPNTWTISEVTQGNVQFDFTEDFSNYFFNPEEDAGRGIGGDQDSDLLASNWETLTAPPPRRRVPEPTSILALGLIGGGMFLSRRRKNG